MYDASAPPALQRLSSSCSNDAPPVATTHLLLQRRTTCCNDATPVAAHRNLLRHRIAGCNASHRRCRRRCESSRSAAQCSLSLRLPCVRACVRSFAFACVRLAMCVFVCVVCLPVCLCVRDASVAPHCNIVWRFRRSAAALQHGTPGLCNTAAVPCSRLAGRSRTSTGRVHCMSGVLREYSRVRKGYSRGTHGGLHEHGSGAWCVAPQAARPLWAC